MTRSVAIAALTALFAFNASAGDSPLRWKAAWPWGPGRDQAPAIGANMGWQPGKFATDLTSGFDAGYWKSRFRSMKARGLGIARIWLFEDGEGIAMLGREGGITGLKPEFIRNLIRLIRVAEEEEMLVYWTLLTGATEPHRPFFVPITNILGGRLGERERFRALVLAPTAMILASTPATFAIDLVNEVEGAIARGTAPGWDEIRSFVTESVQTLDLVAPSVKVTASSGWHVSMATLWLGKLADLGLDFFDAHVYGHSGMILGCEEAVAKAGLPVLLGEFGPLTGYLGERGAAHAYAGLLRSAAECGMAGALPWRVEEPAAFHHSLMETDGSGRWAARSAPLFSLLGY